MKFGLKINATSNKTASRTGAVLACAGAAAIGSSLAFDGIGGCPRLLQEYLGHHHLAIEIFFIGAYVAALGVYLQIKHGRRSVGSMVKKPEVAKA